MNRIIKFRAWDGKQMFDTGMYQSCDPDTVKMWCNVRHDYYELMQYTGLLDKNGVEIYEGDVVKMDEESRHAPTEKLIVEHYGCEYYLKPIDSPMYICTLKDGCSDYLGNYKASHGLAGTVIGNIYQNPELI